MWYVYGLRLANGNVYIGSTNNLKRRLIEHASKKNFNLEFYIAVRTPMIARELEKYCKTGSGKVIIKKRILTNAARRA